MIEILLFIDFKGFKDNEAFDGGTAENYSLTIGSNTFIPGFEEGVIGLAKDEEKKARLGTVLRNLLEAIRVGTILLSAFLPDCRRFHYVASCHRMNEVS